MLHADHCYNAGMSKMRVAVTGGSGRIGSEVIRALVERGHSVVNIDRRQAAEPICRFVYADLRRREQVQPTLEQVDAVCHLGEIPNANVGRSPEEVFWHNTRCGSVVLQTAADLKLQRVIYTSSCQVYGIWAGRGHGNTRPHYLPLDESHPLQPQNVYALSKVANEQYAQLTAAEHGLSIAIFRFPWTAAVDPKSDDAMRWLEKQTGEPDGLATYLHVDDAARAYVAALEHPRPGCEAYHFVAAEVMSAVPIAQRLALHPDYPPLPHDWPAFKSPVTTQKAREHLGWEPQFNLLDAYRTKFGREPGSIPSR
jgi:nucleoside-diphosphate-sugar epimerase